MVNSPWEVQVHGKAGEAYFEISVIHTDNVDHAQRHYGWFDKNKLLITHNGGPCHWPLVPLVWDKMIRVANEVAYELNNPGQSLAV